jgi:hypothetical protein
VNIVGAAYSVTRDAMGILKDGQASYWNRRLKRPCATPTVAEFVLELNRHLRNDPAFRGGVRFVVIQSPNGEEVPSWEGHPQARTLISRVPNAVAQVVKMPAPFQMDPVD